MPLLRPELRNHRGHQRGIPPLHHRLRSLLPPDGNCRRLRAGRNSELGRARRLRHAACRAKHHCALDLHRPDYCRRTHRLSQSEQQSLALHVLRICGRPHPLRRAQCFCRRLSRQPRKHPHGCAARRLRHPACQDEEVHARRFDAHRHRCRARVAEYLALTPLTASPRTRDRIAASR